MTDEPILNIRGDLVGLGPLRRDLIPTYARWVNNLDTLRTLGAAIAPMSDAAEERWYDGLKDSDTRPFTIYELATMRPIGNLDLRDIDHRNRTAMFGLLIGEPDARRKGYGTEATRLAIDYAFTVLGLHHVWLLVFDYNPAGVRCYEKVGFKEVGRRRQSRWLEGAWHDEIIMDIIAPDFTSPLLAELFQPDPPRQ